MNFTLFILNLSMVHAQALDYSSWQADATGLKTTSYSDRKTGGLIFILKAFGVPWISLHGGIEDIGWSKFGGPATIDLGEIKVAGNSPAFTSESADWSGSDVTFSGNLKFWVSRISPAMLVQSLNNSLRLFSGNLAGVSIVPGSSVGEPWNPLVVRDRAPSPSFPKYIAYQSGGVINVRVIPVPGTAALILPPLDNNWILVWYGNNSHFGETKTPIGYSQGMQTLIHPYSEAFQADAPILIKFQNNPNSIVQSSEGGMDLGFNGNSGYSLLLPILGREHPQAADTESWGVSRALPAGIIPKINFWVNRMCSYPVGVLEDYSYDRLTDTASITENITYLNVCSAEAVTSGFAILPPVLALAKDSFGANLNFSGMLQDPGYPSEFGPIIGIDNTDSYAWSVSGLKKYTDSSRILSNGNVPIELTQEAADEVDRIIQSGHYKPWMFVDRWSEDVGDLYFSNPAEVLYHLAEIVPAVPEPQKTQLINYIRNERAAYPPETLCNLPNAGTLRSPFSFDNYNFLVSRSYFRLLSTVPLYSLTGLSRYYNLTQDNVPVSLIDQAAGILNRDMQERDWATFQHFRGFGPNVKSERVAVVNANRQLSGLMGFVDLTKVANNANENLGRSLFVKALVSRLAMAKYPAYLYSANIASVLSDPAWMPKYAARNWYGYIWNYSWQGTMDDHQQVALQDQFGTYLFDQSGFFKPGTTTWEDYGYIASSELTAYKDLTPEAFRLLTDLSKQNFEIYLNKVSDTLPHWYMAYAEALLGNEHNLSHPSDSFQLFMAKAFIHKETADNLRRYKSFSFLDSGDLFYTHKLAETIKAYQGWKWEDEDVGAGMPGDVNYDTQVDVLDIQACVNHILGIQNLGSSADVNQDGSVDVLDVQNIVNIILGV